MMISSISFYFEYSRNTIPRQCGAIVVYFLVHIHSDNRKCILVMALGDPARPTLCLFIGKEKRDERKEFQFDLI